jgi:phage terminase large subunit GpA-like protein
MGQVPNKYAAEFCGSPVLFMTCTVDVHEKNLAVAVMGWTVDSKCFLIDYWRFEDDNCAEATSPAWVRLAELLESKVYEADDGKKYSIALTLVDAGFSNAVVTEFCAGYAAGVYPILGRERTAKNQSIKEFAEFKTQQGSTGYRLLVDHYKERLAPVLKRTWTEETGQQRPYHFNAPVDVTTAQLKELTVEVQRLKEDGRGNTSMEWHRPSGARNELWDLLVYGNAAVEILAWAICIGHFELETIDWPQFWEYIEREKLYFTCEGTPNA